MALIYEAELSPSKPELLGAWVPTRPWSGGAEVTEVVGAYRFDDADGAVGIETHLVRAGGRLLQVPVTYRGEPLPGGEDALIATLEHSVLGRRYVYDGPADPVYLRELLRTMLTGAAGATLWVHREDDDPRPRENDVHVTGSGAESDALPSVGSVTTEDDAVSTLASTGALRVAVARRPATDGGGAPGGRAHLRGTWPGQRDAVVLAVLLGG